MTANNLPNVTEAVKIAERTMAEDRRVVAVVMNFWSIAECAMEITVHRDGRLTDARKL
jgi:hypothetical protein